MLGDEQFQTDYPCVILVVGVNGVGKTTTIGKLARNFVREGKSVVLAAADTFRACLLYTSIRASVLQNFVENADKSAVVEPYRTTYQLVNEKTSLFKRELLFVRKHAQSSQSCLLYTSFSIASFTARLEISLNIMRL